MAASEKVMLFDGDCGFCTTSAAIIGRLGTPYRMVPWQRWPHLAEHGISREPVAGKAYHWIGAHRHRLPGGTPACARAAAR